MELVGQLDDEGSLLGKLNINNKLALLAAAIRLKCADPAQVERSSKYGHISGVDGRFSARTDVFAVRSV